MTDLTAETLREKLLYDALTGAFTWKVRASSRAGPGDSAGTVDSRGYLVVGVAGKQRSAHRLAWLYAYGSWPKFEIDHIDGNRLNNSLANLRDIKAVFNRQNQRRPKSNNSSGFLGVSLCAKTGRWLAHISLNGQAKHLGRFETKELAHNAYITAKRELHAGCTI